MVSRFEWCGTKVEVREVAKAIYLLLHKPVRPGSSKDFGHMLYRTYPCFDLTLLTLAREFLKILFTKACAAFTLGKLKNLLSMLIDIQVDHGTLNM